MGGAFQQSVGTLQCNQPPGVSTFRRELRAVHKKDGDIYEPALTDCLQRALTGLCTFAKQNRSC